MALFIDWFLHTHLELALTEDQHQALAGSFEFLHRSAAEQPQVFVHRDYHSRNLMFHQRHNPGILDFQDAVHGPLTYDLVSLLQDVYICWPPESVRLWLTGYHDLAIQHGILEQDDLPQFLRWFDLMGVQRHLKIAGIFARLYHRDGKAHYLANIPQTLDYLVRTCSRYPALHPIHTLLTDLRVSQRLQAKNALLSAT
jgi:hypothetical protein